MNNSINRLNNNNNNSIIQNINLNNQTNDNGNTPEKYGDTFLMNKNVPIEGSPIESNILNGRSDYYSIDPG